MSQYNRGPYEFLKWIPLENEKYLGVVVVRYERRFIFRYKILPSENGGYWPATGSLKTGIVRETGKDRYDASFDLDSSYENDALKEFAIEVAEKSMMEKVNPNQPASVFNAPAAQPAPVQQSNINYPAQAQQGQRPREDYGHTNYAMPEYPPSDQNFQF